MKYRITAPIYFDGVPFPADTIVDTSVLPISGECLVLRSWGVPYDGDRPAITSVDQLRAPEPVAPPQDPTDPSDQTDPTDLPNDPTDPTDPVPEPEPPAAPQPAPKPKRSRK